MICQGLVCVCVCVFVMANVFTLHCNKLNFQYFVLVVVCYFPPASQPASRSRDNRLLIIVLKTIRMETSDPTVRSLRNRLDFQFVAMNKAVALANSSCHFERRPPHHANCTPNFLFTFNIYIS